MTVRGRMRDALLGTLVGDAMGAPFEGWPADPIRTAEDALAHAPLRYTDDTQMALAVTEHLVLREAVDQEALAAGFLARYEPWRGYGAGTVAVFQRWREGVGVDAAALQVLPGGSYGNGAAMRIAPLGARFCDDEERLRHQAGLASRLTHAHPVGVDGATLLALAVGRAARGGGFGVATLADLAREARTDELGSRLRLATGLAGADVVELGRRLGHDATAQGSVPAALSIAASAPTYAAGVERALQLGGDTDTIAAMTGAILAARDGASSIPGHWLDAVHPDDLATAPRA